MLSDTVTMN